MASVHIGRADHAVAIPTAGTTSGLIPVQYVNDIIQESAKSSTALSTFRTMRMPTAAANIPVMSVLPAVSWVGEYPDVGPPNAVKPATRADWVNVVLQARELAAIVVIPEQTLDDATIDLWSEVRPRLGEAIGKAVDNAILFGGTGGATVPTGWPNGLVSQAATASQAVDLSTVVTGPPVGDFYSAAALAFEKVEEDGYMVNFALGGPYLRSLIRKTRVTDTLGAPLFNVPTGSLDNIFGVPINYVDNGAWQAADANMIIGDRNKVIIGIRQDITFKLLDQATIDVTDTPGTPLLVNLAQQDMIALRVVFRVAYAVAKPVTPMSATPCPFATVVP